jgi:hypothetical protein
MLPKTKAAGCRGSKPSFHNPIGTATDYFRIRRHPVPIRFLTAMFGHADIQTTCSVRKKTFVLQNPLQIAEIRVDMPNSVSYRIAKDREKGSPNAHTIIRTGFKES